MAQPGRPGPRRGQEREHLLIARAPEKPALGIGLIGTGFVGKAHVFGYATAEKVFDRVSAGSSPTGRASTRPLPCRRARTLTASL